MNQNEILWNRYKHQTILSLFPPEEHQRLLLDLFNSGTILKGLTWDELFALALLSPNLNTCNLCKHPQVTWKIIKKYPQLPWEYDILSMNPNITWDIIKKNKSKNWSYYNFSRNPNCKWEYVVEEPDKSWSYHHLSSNPNITWKIIQENPDVDWDYYEYCQNPNFNLHEVMNYKLNPWIRGKGKKHRHRTDVNDKKIELNMCAVARHKNTTWETYLQYPQLNWNYYDFIVNPNMTTDIIFKHKINFQFNGLQQNPNISYEELLAHIKKYPIEKQYDISADCYCFYNPNASFELIKQNADRLLSYSVNYLSTLRKLLNFPHSNEEMQFYRRLQFQHIHSEFNAYYFHPSRYSVIQHHQPW